MALTPFWLVNILVLVDLRPVCFLCRDWIHKTIHGVEFRILSVLRASIPSITHQNFLVINWAGTSICMSSVQPCGTYPPR